MINRQLTINYRLWLVGISLVVGACQLKDTPQPDPVPANLLATAKPDSIVILTEKIDFSTISETGQGPTGTLIQWKNEDRPIGTLQTNTFDAQRRLVGRLVLDYSYGSEGIYKYRYQDDLVAECYVGLRSNRSQPLREIQPANIIRYQYNSNRQLARVLSYRRIAQNTFKITDITDHEYDSAGQLLLSRPIAIESPNSLVHSYRWKNGDLVSGEIYYPANKDVLFPITLKVEYTYNQQPNPYAQIGNPFISASAHNFVRRTSYTTTVNPLVTSPSNYDEVQYDYDQQYDAQGHLIRQRIRALLHNPERWSEWSEPILFTYAP